MRIIDRHWTHLAEGYKTVRSLEEKLQHEWKHSVRAAQERQQKRALTLWRRRRALVISIMLLFVLACVGLCAGVYYSESLKCLFAFWMVIVGFTAAALGVAMGGRIRAAFTRPAAGLQSPVPLELTSQWWQALAPREIVPVKEGTQDRMDFLGNLSSALPETCMSVPGLLSAVTKTADQGVLLLAPSGIWVFEVVFWEGVIQCQDGLWKQVRRVRGKWGRKHDEETRFEPGPDKAWQQKKEVLANVLASRLPAAAGSIQGGVVFIHPGCVLKPENIQGHTAPYGPPGGWIRRIRQAQALKDFSLEEQLQVLEALAEAAHLPEAEARSAQEEAERLYATTAQKLRQYVASWV
jgi:hypothetical protein